MGKGQPCEGGNIPAEGLSWYRPVARRAWCSGTDGAAWSVWEGGGGGRAKYTLREGSLGSHPKAGVWF